MSWSSLGADLAGSVIGHVKKAILIIQTSDDASITSSSVAAETAKVLSAASGSSMNSVTSALKTSGSNMHFHAMQVQFNPSSINISANAREIMTKYLQTNMDASLPNMQPRSESIVMSVELIFDAVSNKDAFHGDKYRLSLSDAAALIGTVAKELTGGYSVQKQTNGLVSTLLRESTGVVTFKWADMSFTGLVSEVQARYTMFAPSGKPIRSSVTLHLNQMLNGAADIKYWDKAFDNFFGKADTAADISGKSKLQEMSKLLNIRF